MDTTSTKPMTEKETEERIVEPIVPTNSAQPGVTKPQSTKVESVKV